MDPPAHPRIQDAGDSFPTTLGIPLAPAQLGVALVRGHHRAELAGLAHEPLQRLNIPDAAGGIPR